jgi:hypothetical protein
MDANFPRAAMLGTIEGSRVLALKRLAEGSFRFSCRYWNITYLQEPLEVAKRLPLAQGAHRHLGPSSAPLAGRRVDPNVLDQELRRGRYRRGL